jgi:hypothetical protein
LTTALPNRPAPPRAAFVAALEFALMDAFEEAAPAPVGQSPARLAHGAGSGFRLPSRLGELVALCSVVAVLAGTAATAGPQVATASTPTRAAEATDTATPAGAVATPVVQDQR